MLEQLTLNQRAVGSSPTAPTNSGDFPDLRRIRHAAWDRAAGRRRFYDRSTKGSCIGHARVFLEGAGAAMLPACCGRRACGIPMGVRRPGSPVRPARRRRCCHNATACRAAAWNRACRAAAWSRGLAARGRGTGPAARRRDGTKLRKREARICNRLFPYAPSRAIIGHVRRSTDRTVLPGCRRPQSSRLLYRRPDDR